MSENVLGTRLKTRREELNLSAVEIAEATGLSKATIHRYEAGDIKQIKLPVIESIAELLGVRPDWLIGKTDQKFFEPEDPKILDIRSELKNLCDYINRESNVCYDGNEVDPSVKLVLVNNLEAIIKLTDKLYEK